MKKNKIDQALAETAFSQEQQKRRGKSLVLALLITSLIALILFVLYIPKMDPPLEQIQEMELGGGGEIVLGQDLQGAAANDFASAGNPQNTPPIEETPIPDPVPETVPNDVEEAKPNEEANVEKKEVKKETPKPIITPPLVTNKTEKKPEEIKEKPKEIAKEPEKVVNKRTLFGPSGAGGPGGTASSQGTGTTAGVQGRPDGRGTSFTQGGTTSGSGPGTTSGSGPGTGNGFKVTGDLSARRMKIPPVIKRESEQSGKINIQLTVDREGNVIEARQTRGTTITDRGMVDYVEDQCKKIKFDPNPDGPEAQYGVITINLSLQ